MSHRVVLNLGTGNWEKGCASVTAQLWLAQEDTPRQFTGQLPPNSVLGELYHRWRQLYDALYDAKQWRQGRSLDAFEIEDDDYPTEISDVAFAALCDDLRQQMNRWLHSDDFRPIDQQLRTHLSPGDEIRVIVSSGDRSVLRLPWLLWDFLEDYPRSELALSLSDYTRSIQAPAHAQSTVRILAILGNGQEIDIEHDQQILAQLPQASITWLVEPTLPEVHHQLWDGTWDMLFFAGHSSSQGTGRLWINATDSLTIDQVRYAVKRAVEQGLQLAIFNSCDGLELAWDLADLHIPQIIVMREPVPDAVAHQFLQTFLQTFSGGRSLYQSVRDARERLQAIEPDFPCATWLPIICQNPAEQPPQWRDWCSPVPLEPLPLPAPRQSVRFTRRVLFSSLLTASVIVLGRSLGLLQPLELWAFDRAMSLRPAEPADHRLLIVTIDESDIQAQDSEERRGSLSDQALSKLLRQLKAYGARTIGLDVYRDYSVSPSTPDLTAQLQQMSELIGICKSADRAYDARGISAPPELPADQVGFSDFLEDNDSRLRRQLLFLTPDPTSACTAPYAFSTRLAFQYLATEGITPEFTADGNLQLDKTVFHRLHNHWGGYQGIDARGNQIMVNYRAVPSANAIAPQVPLTALLNGQVNPDAVRDRLVLIGVTAFSGGDYWTIPSSQRPSDRVSGVVVQAHLISQLLSAVLDHRPLIWSWPIWGDAVWIVGWTVGGSWAVRLGRSPQQRLIIAIAIWGGFSGVCWLLLLQGGWVPWVPVSLGIGMMSGIVLMANVKL